MPEELKEQVPLMQEVLKSMGVVIVTKEGYEADDILGTIAVNCEKAEMEVTVVSGDRDLLQLATDHILIRIPKTRMGKTTMEDYHTAEVLEKYQLAPKQIIDLKALMGDASDNIPGILGSERRRRQRFFWSTRRRKMLTPMWMRLSRRKHSSPWGTL